MMRALLDFLFSSYAWYRRMSGAEWVADETEPEPWGTAWDQQGPRVVWRRKQSRKQP